MATKFYKVRGRFMRLKFFSNGQEYTINFRPTPIDDVDLQAKIEGCRDFGSSIVACDPPSKEAKVEEVEEADKSHDPDDGRLSFGLSEMKSMHVSKLRGITQRANLWRKGMSREEMIEALIGV